MSADSQSAGRLQLHPTLALLARFGVAGVINTLIGLAIVVVLDIGLGVKPAIANAVVYTVGLFLSWLLQRRFVFRSSDTSLAVRARHFVTIATSFGVNQAVLYGMGALLGDGVRQHLIAQVTAMATYTIVQFVLLRIWVFKAEPKA